MTVFSKFCIVCNTQFLTMRISTLFCSKKCSNRARSFPVSLKEQLIRRNSKFSMSMLSHVDRDGTIKRREIVEFDPLENFKKQQQRKESESELWERAAVQARARGIEPTQRQKNTSVYVQKGMADPEMKNFVLDEGQENKNITGFGSHVLDDEMASKIHHVKESEIPTLNIDDKSQTEQPKSVLRKFGSLRSNKENNNGGH